MKKILLYSATFLLVSNTTFAGDYLTNTNQHAAFLRMMARGASIDIDGVYSNPAGLSFLSEDGFYISFTGQSAYQTREIKASYQTYPNLQQDEYYKGKASAPFIPSFQGVYKKGNWSISTGFAVTGGGGKASFDNGLPMFNSMIKGMIAQKTAGKITPDMYEITSAMNGHQYIYGIQLGLSYKITPWLSIFAGGRMNYVKSGYQGYLKANLNDTYAPAAPSIGLDSPQLTSLELNCDQSGWGITPIIGADIKVDKWNFGIKYEFITNLNIENKTHTLNVPAGIPESIIKPYADGEQTPNDIPAYLSIAAGYEILPHLRASLEYHYFNDKDAEMLNNRQKSLTHGTHEYLAGIEYDILSRLTVSGGFQKTNYGLSDTFQTDTSFYCSSYSLGFGAQATITEDLSLDIAYFWTNYNSYTKESSNYNGTSFPGTDIYTRTNKVFGVSLNYHF